MIKLVTDKYNYFEVDDYELERVAQEIAERNYYANTNK